MPFSTLEEYTMSKSKAELLSEARKWAQKHAGEGSEVTAVSRAITRYERIAAEIAALYEKLEMKTETRKATFRELEAKFKDAKKARKQREKGSAAGKSVKAKSGKPAKAGKVGKTGAAAKAKTVPPADAPESPGAAAVTVSTEA